MAHELGAVVEADAAAQARRQGGEQPAQGADQRVGGFARQGRGEQRAGAAVLQHEQRGTAAAELHQVRLPVAGLTARGGLGGALGERAAQLDVVGRAAPGPRAAAPPAAAPLRQQPPPAVVLGAFDLGVDELVDRFVGDHRAARFAAQPARDLLRRELLVEQLQHPLAQRVVALQLQAALAPRPAAGLGRVRVVAAVRPRVALQLRRDRRRRASQSRCDLPRRAAFAPESGDRAALLPTELAVHPSHDRTSNCCPSSPLNLANPYVGCRRRGISGWPANRCGQAGSGLCAANGVGFGPQIKSGATDWCGRRRIGARGARGMAGRLARGRCWSRRDTRGKRGYDGVRVGRV